MKNKACLLLTSLLLFSGILTGQDIKNEGKSSDFTPPFQKGNVVISVASGFGRNYNYYGSYVSLPALSVSTDIGIINNAGPGNIGVGGMVGFKTAYSKHEYYNARWTNYVIAARATYHLTILKHNKFDPYGGVIVGIRIYDYKDSYYNSSYNPYNYNRVYPVTGVFLGAKYNFSKFFAGFAEVGYDISLFRIGFNFCF